MNKQRITESLPSCPFCGGKAIGEVWVDDSRVLRAFIRCQKCGCKTKTMEQMPFESKEDVIKAAIGLWCYRVDAIKQEGVEVDGY